jgi:hypothetical protein
MSLEVKAMPLRFAADHIRRITSRGWRSNAVLLFTVFSCAAFILWKINRETDEVLNSGNTGFTVPPLPTSPEIPTFREVPDSGVTLIIGVYKSSVECDFKRNNNRFGCVIPPRRKRC